jgi:hypothetical protein
MAPVIQTGYLVLADLSGYTPFMASTELDHAQGILTNILELLRKQLTPTLKLAEVEGDAVFLYAPGYALARGETLLELLESTYVTFRDKQRSMQRNATCPCLACQAMPALGLKFVAHCGEYVLQGVTGTPKPFGTSVNLAHRLLKNGVEQATGWRGYALFTETALTQMGVSPEGLYTDSAHYDHLGKVEIGAINLDARYSELTEQRRVHLQPGDAHVTVRRRLRAPPPDVWQWLNDVDRRSLWMKGSAYHVEDRPRGRTGVGAHNHCSNGDILEEVVDWRPFDYFTVRMSRGFVRVLITWQLHRVEAQTDLQVTLALEGSAPRFARAAACRFLSNRVFQVERSLLTLGELVASDWQEAAVGDQVAV